MLFKLYNSISKINEIRFFVVPIFFLVQKRSNLSNIFGDLIIILNIAQKN